MTKNHLKRIAAPKTWPVARKISKFITKPNPGKHKLSHSIALAVVFRELLHLAKSTREIKYMLNNQEILVDAKRVKDHRYMMGLMDILSIPKLNKHYRILLNTKGRLQLIEIDDKKAKLKPCKVAAKKLYKGKIQLSLFDGRTILTDKNDIKVDDTVVIELPSQKIIGHLKLEKSSLVLLTEGKHIGDNGKVEDFKFKGKLTATTVLIKSSSTDQTFETYTKYAFVIGKDKPIIKLIE